MQARSRATILPIFLIALSALLALASALVAATANHMFLSASRPTYMDQRPLTDYPDLSSVWQGGAKRAFESAGGAVGEQATSEWMSVGYTERYALVWTDMPPTSIEAQVSIEYAGFPFISAHREMWRVYDRGTNTYVALSVMSGQPISILPPIIAFIISPFGEPRWAGVGGNFIAYGIVLGFAAYGPRAIRFALRRLRGKCPWCGYTIRTTGVCSECGKHPLLRRPAA